MTVVNSPRSRVSRLVSSVTFLCGFGVTVWVVIGYIATRMKEARLRLVREREKTERVKQHFSSTMSNITFTVYALLPTLSQQILEEINVESLTEELSLLAKPQRSNESDQTPSLPNTSEFTSQASSIVGASDSQTDQPRGIGESWASEFADTARTAPGAPISLTDSTATFSESSEGAAPLLIDHPTIESASNQPASYPNPTGPDGTPYTLNSELGESGTDMSTSMSNFTDPSLASTSPGRDSTLGTARESHAEGADSTGDRYLRSPSLSPRGVKNSHEAFGHVDEQKDQTAPGPLSYAEAAQPTPEQAAHLAQQSHTTAEQSQQDHHALATIETPAPGPVLSGRSKAQLWGEIKIQTLTRTILTIYLAPLLSIHTTSQLTLLARLHHLQALSSMNASTDSEPIEGYEIPLEALNAGTRSESSVLQHVFMPWTYFSIDSMKLQEYQTKQQRATTWVSSIPVIGPVMSAGSSLLLGGNKSSESLAARRCSIEGSLYESLDQETERTFLLFSWWLLHVGWRELEETIRYAVKTVFKPVSLKKEVTAQDWLELVDAVKAKVDTDLAPLESDRETQTTLHDILFPPASPAKFNHLLSKHGLLDSCPIPPPPYAHPLASLLNQSSSHVSSPDFKLLLETCMQRMTVAVLDRLAIEVYDEIDIIPVNDGYEQQQQQQPVARIESQKTRRVVECLPFLTRWSGDIWAHVPAEPIERVLRLAELEGFAALIYADFGNGLDDA